MNRSIIVELTTEDMQAILLGDKKLVLPAGATIATWWLATHWEDAAAAGESLFLRVEHPSFAEVESGRRYPRLQAELVEHEALAAARLARRPSARALPVDWWPNQTKGTG